ncbi:MAG TPA: tetratricopeptide repeat protein, partial [Verrucomicrobiae bacterium]|nr:tetratricopeptide repeat protein [Verrucomicrobiae bacterium]
LAQQGHADAAIAEFQHATELDPANSIARADLASLQIPNGKLDDAIANLRAAAKYDPENADLHNKLGALLAQTGQYEPAITEFQAALKLNPSLPRAAENLALAQKLKDKPSGKPWLK